MTREKTLLVLLSCITLFIGCKKEKIVLVVNEPNLTVPVSPAELSGIIKSTIQIDLSWTDKSTNETGFKIERKVGNGNYSVIETTKENVTTFSDVNLLGSNTYTYRIYAFNSRGNSQGYSNEVTLLLDTMSIRLADGLVGHYSFTGNAEDSSVNKNHGVPTATVLSADRFNRQNSAFLFNGINSYVRIKSINMDKSKAMTISVWIKPNNLTSKLLTTITRQEGPIGKLDWILAFQNAGKILSFGLSTESEPYNELDLTINPDSFTDGKWHHLLALYDGEKRYIYLDNKLIGSNSKSGIVSFTSIQASIGSTSATLEEFFNGQIDDLRFYKRALTSAEIKHLSEN